MKLRFFCLFIIFCFLACSQKKSVKFYDETKVSKNEIAFLLIPNDIDLSKINEEFINAPITNKEYELQIPKGHHTLTARYYCLWNTNSGENTLVKSSKVKINIDLEAGKSYQLLHKPLKNYTEALAFETSPIFYVKELKEAANIIAPEKNLESPTTSITTDKKSLDVLKLIWENSSEDDKRKFLDWLKEKK